MLMLIDGSNLAYRALHALYKKESHYSFLDAIPLFLKRLAKLVEYQYLQAGVIIAWDKGLPLHRRELYSEYKPDSTPIGDFPQTFLSKINLDPDASHRAGHSNKDLQREYVKLITVMSSIVIPNCNCVSLRVDNCEADDIIAYMCYHLPHIEKQISSSDKDFLQLINETTSIYNFRSSHLNGNLYDYEWVYHNYDNPKWFKENFLLEKAIVGDISDNIPGIDKVGKISARKYSDAITYSRSLGSSLQESLHFLERPGKATQKGHLNLKNGIEILKRNIDLMDLYLPIERNLPFIGEIKKAISLYSYLNREYYECLDKIENIEGLDFSNCGTSIDTIYESNCNFEMESVLKNIGV